MNRTRLILPALLAAFLAAAPVACGSGGKAEAPQGAAADRGADTAPSAEGDLPVVHIGGRVLTAAELEPLLEKDVKDQHAMAALGLLNFDQLLEGLVNRELLREEGRRRGLDRAVEKGLFRYRRDYIEMKDFLANDLGPQLRATPEEIAAAMPKDLRKLTVRQILLSSEEEAEDCLRELRDGADFVELIRERSIGPEARKDGLLWGYRVGDGIYPPEIEEYLFSLPLDTYSKVFNIGLGYCIARVEGVEEPRPGTEETLRAKLDGRIGGRKVEAEIQRIVAGVEHSTLPRDQIYALVEDWWERSRIEDKTVVELPGDRIGFADMVVIAKDLPNHSLEPKTPEMVQKFVDLARNLAVEWILARESERRGHVLGPAASAELERLRGAAMLMALYAEEIEGKTAVTPEEVRAFYDRDPARFSQRAGPEVRHILLPGESQAKELLRELRAGLDFEEAARNRSMDSATSARGGLVGVVSPGQTVPEFEAAANALREPGELSPPVKTRFGWHIIQLVGRREAQRAGFEEVRERVEAELVAQRREQATREFLERLRKATPVTYEEQNLASFRQAFIREHLSASPTDAQPSPHGAR